MPENPCPQVESHKDGLVSPSMYTRIISLLRQIVSAHACRIATIFFPFLIFSTKTCFRLLVEVLKFFFYQCYSLPLT